MGSEAEQLELAQLLCGHGMPANFTCWANMPPPFSKWVSKGKKYIEKSSVYLFLRNNLKFKSIKIISRIEMEIAKQKKGIYKQS